MSNRSENEGGDPAAERFAAAAKAQFDNSVDALDAATLSRLNQNRQRALAARSPLSPFAAWWLPASGVTAAALVAVVLWTGSESVVELTPPSVATDLEIILEVDDFEMLEDLEFYSWIDLDEQGDGNVG